MPKLREAYVDVVSSDFKSVVGSATSVKRLTICAEMIEFSLITLQVSSLICGLIIFPLNE